MFTYTYFGGGVKVRTRPAVFQAAKDIWAEENQRRWPTSKCRPCKHLSSYPLLTEPAKKEHPYQTYLPHSVTLPLTAAHIRRTPTPSLPFAFNLRSSLYILCLARQLWS